MAHIPTLHSTQAYEQTDEPCVVSRQKKSFKSVELDHYGGIWWQRGGVKLPGSVILIHLVHVWDQSCDIFTAMKPCTKHHKSFAATKGLKDLSRCFHLVITCFISTGLQLLLYAYLCDSLIGCKYGVKETGGYQYVLHVPAHVCLSASAGVFI